ncbi:short chain dehydrogenase [Wilcoxina mikolae CBS 423.85]|nr:short chain dehydrogenase [Wilcoxina mikolae CBS 423.85]
MVYDLKNRNVLVTGGSRGLGALTAERFAEEGANVVINYASSASAAEELAEKLKVTYGVQAAAIQADVGEESECHRLISDTIEVLGGLDIIISNAGWTRIAAFSNLTSLTGDEWDKCWAVNTKATLFLLQSALPTFTANPEGGVVLITSSAAATNATGSSMAYSVSKAAGLHLMKCLAATQGPKVRVNAVQPGLLLTEWGRTFGEAKVEAATKKTKLGRLGGLDDTAEAFVYLAKADTVTGASLKIDGGAFEN